MMEDNKSTWKWYECTKCGYKKQIETNHNHNCFSYSHFNTCTTCPPYKKYPEFGGQTTWKCIDPNETPTKPFKYEE